MTSATDNTAATDPSEEGVDSSIKIYLVLTSSPSSPKIPLMLSKSSSPSSMHELVSSTTRISSDKLKVIFRGRIVPANNSEGNAVDQFKLEDGSVVHCMGKPQEANDSSLTPGAGGAVAEPASSRVVGSTVTPPPAASSAIAPPAVRGAAVTLDASLRYLERNATSPSAHLTALTTLHKILDNISSNPMEEKYRKIRASNAAFHRRLGGVPGGKEVLLQIGFVVEKEGEDDIYVIHPSPEKWESLVRSKDVVKAEVDSVKRQQQQQQSTQQSVFNSQQQVPGLGNGSDARMDGGLGMGMPNIPPGMENMVNQMLSNPNALQAMLQNPMLQQAMNSDPRFSSNPAMRQTMEQLANNPSLVQQMSRMLSDPGMRDRIGQMMNNVSNMPGISGGGGGFDGVQDMAADGSGRGGSSSSEALQQIRALQGMMGMMQQHQQGVVGAGMSSTGGVSSGTAGTGQGGQTESASSSSREENDSQMTEEEMIAEAIARSLRES